MTDVPAMFLSIVVGSLHIHLLETLSFFLASFPFVLFLTALICSALSAFSARDIEELINHKRDKGREHSDMM